MAAVGLAVLQCAGCIYANWPNGPWSRIMSKIIFAVLASMFMFATFPALSWGQSAKNACGCGTVAHSSPVSDSQGYRRFSYEPAPSVQGNIVTGTTMVPVQPTNVSVIPQTFSSMQSFVPQSQVYSQTTPTQSYRRFSYQPAQSTSPSSHATDQPWRYSKTDPRRYR